MQTQADYPLDYTQAPKAHSDTSTHYGYVAYNDISLLSSAGLEYKVQPANSPYYFKLPAKTLLPFTNIEVSTVNEEIAGSLKPNKYGRDGATKIVSRSAKECIREIEQAYEAWGFAVLTPLTGLPVQEAYEIFNTVQPEAYLLGDIVAELENADIRIETSGLTPSQKVIAFEVRDLCLKAAEVAVALAQEQMENTIESMNSRFSGGNGKAKADPRDKYIFGQFKRELPRLVDTPGTKPESDILQQLAAVFQPKPNDIDALREELQQELAEVKTIKEEWNAKFRDKFKKKEVAAA